MRLHAVTPSVFFGIPWIILGGAWLVMVIIGIIAGGAGADTEKMGEGMRYSWAVLSPQWYLVAVGVQAIGLTLSFALGFGTTRRDFWLGTSLMFGIVSLLNAVAIATLVQIEKATDGWWLDIAMFDALWYGQNGLGRRLLHDARTAALRALHRGERHDRVPAVAHARHDDPRVRRHRHSCSPSSPSRRSPTSWPAIFEWFGSIGIVGVFTVVLGLAALFAIGGYLVIRRATPR